jgi:hypothetical protein
MGQNIALPGVLANKASRSLALEFIQPAHASLQATLRAAEFQAPEVNSVRFKADMVLPICIGEVLY